MANIKFFRKNTAPSNPVEGWIWFNTDDRTINLYKSGAWEQYSGIKSATYTNKVLTITPCVGSAVTVDLSDMASASALSTLSQSFDQLQTSFNTLSGEFSTEKGKISTLEGKMATVETEVAKLSDITGKVGAYVVTKIGEEENARKAADDVLTKAVNDEVTRATGIEANLQSAINTEKGRIDALVGEGIGSIRDIATAVLTEVLVADDASEAYDTLQEMSAWLQSHPENAATMDSAISANTTAVGTLSSDVTTIKTNIQTINAAIEENGDAIADLDERITNLGSGTVSSVTGSGYISATTTSGAVTVTANTGAVANGGDVLAVASDVKSYVDSMMSWGEF